MSGGTDRLHEASETQRRLLEESQKQTLCLSSIADSLQKLITLNCMNNKPIPPVEPAGRPSNPSLPYWYNQPAPANPFETRQQS